ncbi:MAG: type II toxin-antitoxin system RelE/ParE family toxin [Terriglobia bacterium]|jgi:mRNA-degrading endonuclease RelE of RelBE toxin-antitoxin system
MNWVVRIADDAQLFVQNLPDKTRRQVSGSISQASLSKTHSGGDVKPLRGKEWKGYYRKRAGDYRIIFSVYHDRRLVDVSWVLRRSEKTYR